jgi:stage II sporulation protein D
MKHKLIYLLFFFFYPVIPVLSQSLRVGIFNDLNTKALVFSVVEGSYLMTADDRAIKTFKPGENLYVAQEGDSLRCIMTNANMGTFNFIKFSSMTDSSVFSIRPVEPQSKVRFYDDNLELSMQLGKLQTINVVDIEKYIAGVVEAEGGYKGSPEYYKTQATLCRTYALSHLDRHTEEFFHLCDGVHCQAFHGKSTSSMIYKSAFDTRGIVVIDTDSSFITASFHSDCGGETESASNVWLINKPYLKPVQDPYCQEQKNYRWEKKFSIEDWKQYLLKSGFHFKANASPAYFNAAQFNRKQYYKLGSDSITYRRIRSDFKLRSAFFSVEYKRDSILLHGRGYGHGAGLCQEGAMQMAKLGYNYKEIIQFYYQAVKIVGSDVVPGMKNPSLTLLKKRE